MGKKGFNPKQNPRTKNKTMITLTVIGILIYLYGGWVFYGNFVKSKLNILEVKENMFQFLCSGAFFISTLFGVIFLFLYIIPLLIIKYLP